MTEPGTQFEVELANYQADLMLEDVAGRVRAGGERAEKRSDERAPGGQIPWEGLARRPAAGRKTMKKQLRQWHEWPESTSPAAEQFRHYLWDVIQKLDRVSGELTDIATPTPGETLFQTIAGWRQTLTDLMYEIDDFAVDSTIDEELA